MWCKPAKSPQLVRTLDHDFLAQSALDFFGVHLGNTFETVTETLRKGADRVTGLLDGNVLAGEAFLLLLQLMVKQAE